MTAVKLGQQHPLLVFEEHPSMFNTHWLTDVPIKVSRESSSRVVIWCGNWYKVEVLVQING